MNFKRFLLGCLLAWGAVVGALGLFDTLRHHSAKAAAQELTWGLDRSVTPANVCLYYTSASCFNIGTMSAAGAFQLPLTNIAPIAAETLLGNATTSAAVPTAVQMPYGAPQGRLTLTTGTPILVANAAASTTVFYTPYAGNQAPLPDAAGGGYIMTPFAELSQTTTDNTKSPAAVAASSCYDVFLWNDAGTIRATRGAVWSSCISRGAAAAITRTKGLFVNSLAVTNGPAAGMGVKVGAIASNAASTIDYIFGGSSSGGTASRLEVCNDFNKVPIVSQVSDSGAAYTYSVATIRQARASTGNQVSLMSCAANDAVSISYQTECATINVNAQGCEVGVGLDSTTSYGTPRHQILANSAVTLTGTHIISFNSEPGLGVHIYSANEKSIGAAASFFNNQGFNSLTVTVNH